MRSHRAVGIALLVKSGTVSPHNLYFADRDRVQHPLAHEIGQLGAVDVVDVDRLRLGQRAVELDVVGDGLHRDLEAEILASLLGDLLDRRIQAAGMHQRHVLDVLRPDGGKKEGAAVAATAPPTAALEQELGT